MSIQSTGSVAGRSGVASGDGFGVREFSRQLTRGGQSLQNQTPSSAMPAMPSFNTVSANHGQSFGAAFRTQMDTWIDGIENMAHPN